MKPKVVTNCIANHYTGSNERIVEFSHANGGGLISIFAHDDGTLTVDIYRTDPGVIVRLGKDVRTSK